MITKTFLLFASALPLALLYVVSNSAAAPIRVGKGNVFYFRPGHETYKIFFEAAPLKIVENAVLYLGGKVEAR